MRVGVVYSFVLAVSLLISSQLMAADFGGPQSYCHLAEDTYELSDIHSVSLLRGEVHSRFEHAAEVSKSSQAIHSMSPLFVWANEAKISCAKVYGSLRKSRQWRKRPDHVMLQKCECFYKRMTQYLGH
jgi:hypothetical protein